MDEKLWRLAQMLLGSKALPPFEQPGQSIPMRAAQGGIGIGATPPPLPPYGPLIPPQQGLFTKQPPVTVQATPPAYGAQYAGLHNQPYGQQPLPPFQQPGQALNQAVPFNNTQPTPAAPQPAPVAPPGGLLPNMLPAAQPTPAAAPDPVAQYYTDEQRAIMDALVKRSFRQELDMPNRWVNPWQAP